MSITLLVRNNIELNPNPVSNFGIFNVSVLAKNRVTEVAVFDDIMSIVTEVKQGTWTLENNMFSQAPCSPPKLSIPFNSTDPLVPAEYFRADQIVINTNAILNCTPVITTKYKPLFCLCVLLSLIGEENLWSSESLLKTFFLFLGKPGVSSCLISM